MSVSSVSSQPPVYQLPQTQNTQKPTTQNAAHPVASDSDGDNDGSGGVSAVSTGAASKVNITA